MQICHSTKIKGKICYYLSKKEEYIMKKIINLLSKLSVGVLTFVIFSVANSSSCYYIHQPKEPKEIKDFKWIK